MEAWYTKFDGDQDKGNIINHHLMNNDATIIVFRGWGEGVDPIYTLEKRENGELALNPMDKRFEEFIVYSFEEAAQVFTSEYCPHEDSRWEVVLCMGVRGLTQYLMTVDSSSYWMETMVSGLHTDDMIRMLFLCAEKLGMEMNIESKMVTGQVSAYQTTHKINVGTRPMYLMDLASEIRKSGAIITMSSPNYEKEVVVEEKKPFMNFLFSR